MAQMGRRLIIDKTTNKVVYDFGEASGSVPTRPDIENIIMVDLDYGQYSDEFSRLKNGLDSITLIDAKNKVLQFDLNPPQTTQEQQIAELQQQLLQTQGVV